MGHHARKKVTASQNDTQTNGSNIVVQVERKAVVTSRKLLKNLNARASKHAQSARIMPILCQNAHREWARVNSALPCPTKICQRFPKFFRSIFVSRICKGAFRKSVATPQFLRPFTAHII